MPVSKRPRNKQPQKKKQAVPFKKLTGYQVVSEVTRKTDDILGSIAVVCRALPALEAKFTPEEAADSKLALKRLAEALSDVKDPETGVINRQGLPRANLALHDGVKRLSEMSHVSDDHFIDLMARAEDQMFYITHNVLESHAYLSELVLKYVEATPAQEPAHVD